MASSMIPERGDDRVFIPTTIDLIPGSKALTTQKWLISAALLLIWGFLVACFIIALDVWYMVILYSLGSFIAITTIIRFVVIKERFFRMKQRELMERKYQFGLTAYWNIYEISNGYPTIVYYSNGMKAIFVEMKKGVIVGKDDDADYDHHEAICNALQQMVKRGIECIHIDHMDVVGRDDRLNGLFDMISQAENDDLRKVLTIFLDNVQFEMNQAYADYDVYAFLFRGREDIFWEELQVVLRAFRNANYVADKILSKADIRELVLSVMNLRDFSVNNACDQVFSNSGIRKYIKVIATTKDNKRTVLAKTSEQIMQENRVIASEKDARREKRTSVSNIVSGRRRREQNIDIFDNTDDDNEIEFEQDLTHRGGKTKNTEEEINIFDDTED